MNIIKIGFAISVMGSFPLLGMQLATKNGGSSRMHTKSDAARKIAKNARLLEVTPDKKEEVIRGLNPREFAVIALRISNPDVQQNAVNQLLQTSEARQALLNDIRSDSGARAVDTLNQVSSLIEQSNKRRLSLAADHEEQSALEDRIAKSKRLFKVSPSQEEFFWMSDAQRATMSKLSKHFDPSLGSSVPTSINLSKKEWEDLGGISRQLRGEFRTQEDYFKGNRMPETEDKVTYVAQKFAQNMLLGVGPGTLGGWIGQMGNELGNTAFSGQLGETVVASVSKTARGTMHNAVKTAEQLALGSLSQEDQSLHKLSTLVGTFGANFPEDAKNDLIKTFRKEGPEMIGDAAIKALDNPVAILGSPSMMVWIGAGATRGLVKGVGGMNNPVETKNIPQI